MVHTLPVRALSIRARAVGAAVVLLGSVGAVSATPASASPRHPGATDTGRVCPPAALAVGFSDALDKTERAGVRLGGLSSLAYDRRSGRYAATVDNHLSDPARIWFFRDLAHPRIVGEPLILRRPHGTVYDGTTADDEGLAVLPDGDFLVSSETEPSIRVFGRDGVQKATLPIPARFAVAPTGEATRNATLEGLTVSPDGRQVIAAMEGTLSGDIGAAGQDTFRRLLVYRRDRGGAWTLRRQLGYQVQPGNRIAEVQSYGRRGLLVLEAAFAPATGNTVELYAVPNTKKGRDISAVSDLATAPGLVLAKRLVADVTRCPTLGATAKQPQTNPLLDNYEGMTLRPIFGAVFGVSLISDDNFGATQVTRVLNLVAVLP